MKQAKMNNRFYIITYDLKNEDYNYIPLYDAIKSLGEWQHPIESTWIVNTSMNADEIIRKLHSDNIMSDKDILFVCQLKIGDRNGWMGKSVWEWIRKIEESQSKVSRENLCSYIKDEPYRIEETEAEDNSDDRYVDLGLSSGTLWADHNVVASNSEESRDYNTFNKAQELGTVPTQEQFKELIEECKWNWKGNGYEVTGPNGNSIYFPAAGYYDNSCVCDIYTRGFYWSSSINNKDYCYYLYFNRDDIGIYNDNGEYARSLSVRLVK